LASFRVKCAGLKDVDGGESQRLPVRLRQVQVMTAKMTIEPTPKEALLETNPGT